MSNTKAFLMEGGGERHPVRPPPHLAIFDHVRDPCKGHGIGGLWLLHRWHEKFTLIYAPTMDICTGLTKASSFWNVTCHFWSWNSAPHRVFITVFLGPLMKMRVPYSNHSLCPSICMSTIFCGHHCGQSIHLTQTGCGDHPWGADVHGHRILVLWQTLNLEILWTLLCPGYWCPCGQFVPVNYAWGVDVHGHGVLVQCPLTLELWHWPWGSCGRYCV